MLIEHAEYGDEASLSPNLEGAIFRYCSFNGFSVDGKSIDAIFLSCELQDLNWYWGLFNCCLFVDTRFVNCVFQGVNFADCRFLNCEFIDCRFKEDNLHSPCSFDGTQWLDGKIVRCEGVPDKWIETGDTKKK